MSKILEYLNCTKYILNLQVNLPKKNAKKILLPFLGSQSLSGHKVVGVKLEGFVIHVQVEIEVGKSV